jgi:Domain of unknown function (DUF4917)
MLCPGIPINASSYVLEVVEAAHFVAERSPVHVLGCLHHHFRTVFSFEKNRRGAYLHGALHLFSNEQREVLKLIRKGTTILTDIASKILTGPERPLIVSEGTAAQKISKIRSIPYLNICHEHLPKLSGSLFIFGSSASETDSHIYEAICESHSLSQIFFCVHNPASLSDMCQKLARYQAMRRSISWSYVDAGTVNVWGSEAKTPVKSPMKLTVLPP